MGSQSFSFGARDTLLITADVPTVSQLTRASAGESYLSLVMDLDPNLIAELATEMQAVQEADHAPIHIGPTDDEVADAALRLMRLLERPSSRPVLQAQRIARAVALLRAEYTRRLPVETFAAVVGMSPHPSMSISAP